MTRLVLLAILAVLVPVTAFAQKPDKQQQKEADRHFKSGVALYKEAKYGEALAEFERAYEIAPHPLVLYNIAGCHRELSHYADAVKFYNRFLTEGKGKVPAARLTTAQTELDGILARIARVTVTVAPSDGATIILDGNTLGTLVEMPLMLPPGEHKLVARATGYKDVERTVRVASGDELTIELTLVAVPPEPTKPDGGGGRIDRTAPVAPETRARRFNIGAAFGTNLRQVGETGAPSVGLGVAIGSRIVLGIDAVVVAYSVMPSIRVRLAGDQISVHAIGAVPVSFTDGEMSETFVAGAAGLGVRYRPTPMLAFRLEALASFAGEEHGTTVPAFVGGELWF
ncbi:MAG TPA: PEGA domain-containing protein [Kofleriaceae bacterium]